MSKWIFRVLGLLAFFLLGLIAYVEINKEEIIGQVVTEVNKSLKTPIKYDDADVSLLKSFPDVRVSLYDVNLSDSMYKESPLMLLGEASVALNIVDAIKNTSDIKINNLTLKDGNFHVINRKDGTNNYDIVIESTSTTEAAEPLDLTINSYLVENVGLIYSDWQTGDQYRITGLNSNGQIKYNSGNIGIISDITASLDMNMLNTPLSLKGDIELEVDEAYEKYQLHKGLFHVNDLPLDLSGQALMKGANYNYEFDISSPSTEVKKLLSLLPQVYRNQYDSMVSSGSFSLSGHISGDDKAPYPLYNMKLALDGGKMSYPDLKKSIDDLSFDIDVQNTNGNSLYTDLFVKELLAKLGDSELSGDIHTKSRGTANDIDVDIRSNLNLSDVYESFHWDGVTALSGTVNGDLKAKTTIDNSNKINIDDDLMINMKLQDILYDNASTGRVSIQTVLIEGGTNEVRYVVDDFNYPGVEKGFFKGTVNQPLKALEENAELSAKADISIGLIDFVALTANVDTSSVSAVYDIPNLTMVTTARITKINYPPYNIEGIQAKGTITDDISTLSYTIDDINHNKFYGNGELVNVLQYGLNNDTLSGKLELRSDKLTLDDFMTEESETTAANTGEPLIPGNLAIDIDYAVTEMTYQKLDLSKAIGDLSIADQKVQITNSASVFGGAITFTGTFDAKNPIKPNIDLNIDISQISFQETANQLAFFNTILPIASFFEGEYNGTLNWKSELFADYFPDLNTLSAFGEIETKNGGIASFIPIDTILSYFGKKEDVKKTKWKLDDTKKYFLVEDGRVIVKKVAMKKDDINVAFSGSHSFAQEIDYDMIVTIPKDKIKIDKVYGLVTKTLNLSNELDNLTDDIMIDLVLKLGGKINKPTFNLSDVRIKRGNVVESIKESAIATAKEKKEQVETTVRDTIEYAKNTVKDSINVIKNKAEAQIDSTKTQILTQIDSSKTEVTKAATGILDSLKAGKTDSLGAAIDDIFKNQKDKINDVKDKIKIDIFKKKTKN